MATAKTFYIQHNIGKCRYCVNFHDGEQKHKDGSPFYDLKIFSNKRELNKFTNSLRQDGYAEK